MTTKQIKQNVTDVHTREQILERIEAITGVYSDAWHEFPLFKLCQLYRLFVKHDINECNEIETDRHKDLLCQANRIPAREFVNKYIKPAILGVVDAALHTSIAFVALGNNGNILTLQEYNLCKQYINSGFDDSVLS